MGLRKNIGIALLCVGFFGCGESLISGTGFGNGLESIHDENTSSSSSSSSSGGSSSGGVVPPTCGNGTIDLGEQCDGSELGDQTCDDLWYVDGTLSCTESCTLNFDGCERGPKAPSCGNHVLEYGEQCDDGNSNPHDGCHECFYAVPENGQVHSINQNDASCDDAGDGQSVPWCNILPMDAHDFSPGDSVVIRGGRYNAFGRDRTDWTWHVLSEADVAINDEGTAENPIVIMAYPGEEVVLENELGAYAGYGFGYPVLGLLRAKHAIIQGFTFDHGTSFITYGSNNIVRGNTFIGLLDNEPYWPGNVNYAGLQIVQTRNALVRNNRFQDYIGGGEASNNSAIQMWGYSMKPTEENNVIENNEFYHCSRGVFDKDNFRWNTFRKNYFHDVRRVFVLAAQDRYSATYDYDEGLKCYNLSVYQNVIKNSGAAFLVNRGYNHKIYNNLVLNTAGITLSKYGYGVEVEFFNNIFVAESSSTPISSSQELTVPVYMDYNLYSPFTQIRSDYATYVDELTEWQAEGYDLHSQEAVPAFAEEGRYTLSPSSPARGVGRYGEDLGLYPDGNENIVIGKAKP